MSDKIELKEKLAAVDLGAKEFWDELNDDQRKALKSEFYILNRYISNAKTSDYDVQAHFVLTVNEYFNKHWNVLQKHPKLLWQLLCMCSHESRKIFYHEWIGFKSKKGNNKIFKFLSEIYPNKKDDELELLSKITTDKELKKLRIKEIKNLKEKDIIINNNIQKESFGKFYNNFENKIKYSEFVYLTKFEAERLINDFGQMYFEKSIEYLSLWKLEKYEKKKYQDCTGDDNLKIRKWVIFKVKEDFKRLNYNGYKNHEEMILKANNPEILQIMKDLLDSGYAKDKDTLLKADLEKLKFWHNDYLQRKKIGGYK
jgi:hypothetical protein